MKEQLRHREEEYHTALTQLRERERVIKNRSTEQRQGSSFFITNRSKINGKKIKPFQKQ